MDCFRKSFRWSRGMWRTKAKRVRLCWLKRLGVKWLSIIDDELGKRYKICSSFELLATLPVRDWNFGIPAAVITFKASLNDKSIPFGIANAQHNNTHEVFSWAFFVRLWPPLFASLFSRLSVSKLASASSLIHYLDSFLGGFDVHVVLDVSPLVFWRNVHDLASFLALYKWRWEAIVNVDVVYLLYVLAKSR